MGERRGPTAEEGVAALRRRGVEFALAAGHLRVKGLPDERRGWVAAHKAEIVALLEQEAADERRRDRIRRLAIELLFDPEGAKERAEADRAWLEQEFAWLQVADLYLKARPDPDRRREFTMREEAWLERLEGYEAARQVMQKAVQAGLPGVVA